MKRLALAAVFLVASIMALGGMASAVDSVAKDVQVGGTVAEALNFNVIYASSNQYVSLGAIGPGHDGTGTTAGSLFSTVDWQIDYTSTNLADGAHVLQAPLGVVVSPNSGNPGNWGGSNSIHMTYTQSFTNGDYAGDYDGTVVLTASAAVT